MGCWDMLPAELRLMVFELLAEDYQFNSAPYARAGYASVCREWQPFWEQRNFQRIVLDQERIAGLDEFMSVRRRQDYLEHLFLRVRLDEYDCTVCQSREDDETMEKNNKTLGRAVRDLLVVLSKWTRSQRRHTQQGLTLELGVYSPSDSKHTFRSFRLEHGYPYQEEKDLEMHYEEYRLRADRLGLDSLNDAYHGWVNGRRDVINLEAALRTTGTATIDIPESGTSSEGLPKVKIVTGLLIRRQFYRDINVTSLNKLIHNSFRRLRWFRCEGWYHIPIRRQLRYMLDYKNLIGTCLPASLRDLFLFEDFNEPLHPIQFEYPVYGCLGEKLSKSCRHLENLSAAFLVEAVNFFAKFWPTRQQDPGVRPWKNLRTLALTSSLLRPGVSRREISNLLMAAGLAAAFMPKLEVMEIWNGGPGHACFFRYSSNAGRPRITWASNWEVNNVQLRADVVSCWEGSLRHGQYPSADLTAEVMVLPGSWTQAKSYLATIRHLQLRRNILDPISDYQLHWEEHHPCEI